MNYLFSEIAQILNAPKKFIRSDHPIYSVYIDTRQIAVPQNALFAAISSHKNDGHKYIPDAYKKGIRYFLVQYLNDDFFYEDANYILTDDTIRAIQQWAVYHRRQFNIPVIGITGSNGKTIVKEWLYFLLKEKYNICRSPRSFNSQIGVPLSVLNLNNAHTLAIFEAGISLPREMNVLEKIIQPDISILTHFGNAHAEGFENDEQKLKEKLKLFQHSQINIIQRLNNAFLQSNQFPENFICISENNNDDVVVQNISRKKYFSSITLLIDKNTYTFKIPFVDDASIKNAITCFVCIYYFNPSLIQSTLSKMENLPVISLRMEIKKGRFQSVLIDDYYNSDIDSFETAVSYLHLYTHHAKKILILSDFEEVRNSEELYEKIKQIINRLSLSKLILIGNEWQNHLQNIKPVYHHYFTTSEFLDNLKTYTPDFFDSVILLKGARKFEFEKIAEYLELKTHDTALEINIPALWHNLSYYKNIVGKNVKLMCMLKASGYGSGSTEMAYALQKFGVDYIAVAYTDEGVELRQANIQIPVMVMLPEKNSFKDIINYQLEPEIYSFEILHAFVKELEKQGIQHYPIHLKLDTGMHRLGFLPNEIKMLTDELKNNSYVKVKSIFSHLAASESDEHKEYTLNQISLFEKLSDEIANQLNYNPLRHICNSAAVNRFPQAHFDMVRLGIGMYGISDNADEQKILQNVLTLKTKIVQIKTLEKNSSIGYSRKSILDKDSKIAVIPIGYADGFSRLLGNKNFSVRWKNKSIPVIGNVCMDMTMIDITNTDAQVGDEVVIFSTADEIKTLSNICKTIPYEILTSISQRVKRVYVYE